VTWIFGPGGASGRDGRLLVLHGLETMALVRLLLRARPQDNVGVGVELAGGEQVPWLLLRGESTSHPGPVFAPSLLMFAGSKLWGYGFRLGYVVAGMNDAVYGQRLPTGGVTFSVSTNLMLEPRRPPDASW